jgi:hypothetical protein
VSLAKSSIFFSPNTHAILRSEICEVLNIDTEALSDKYLGLPALVGAKRSDCFKHFIERIIQHINGWKEKQLSIKGKEILLKAIAQAIPVYAMSVFLIPKGVCKSMMMQLLSFGGATMQITIGCIGLHGGNYAFQRMKVGWDFVTSSHLIMLCWLNRFGGLLMNQTPSVHKFFGQSTILMVIF